MSEKSKLKLSPSRTKTFFDCSLKYWYSYKGHKNGECGIPGTSNDGARRGGVTHAVLECLSNPKRRKKVEKMVELKDPWHDEATRRLAYILAVKEGVHDHDNFEMIRQFILAAIQSDFYCDGADSVEIERHFLLEGDGFTLNGFIDKAAVGKDSVRIIDYKTSKKKFSKEELNFNLQNYFYTYAAQQLWPGKTVTFDFQFLKFPPKVTQTAPTIGEREMEGFSVWLKEVSQHIDSLTFEDAKGNTPKDKGPGKSWACGKKDLTAKKPDGSEHWACDYRKPFLYFALSRDGKTIKTDRNRIELDKIKKEGDLILQCSHPGCWAWREELKNNS
jgi:hypothetical protein